jgi:hypothetical protein
LDSFSAFVSQNLGVFAVLIALVAVSALVVGMLSFLRIQAVARPFSWLTGQWDGEMDSLPALLQTVEKNAKEIDAIHAAVDGIVNENRTHFKRIGLVRYDAFDGIAGQQSYSLCLLDENRSGFVLSNLVGRDFVRSYAIEISGGEAPRKLGDEEGQALKLALDSKID